MIAQTSMEAIKKLLAEVKPILIQIGVPLKQIRVRKGKHQIKACGRAFDWLHDLKISAEMAEYKGVRALLPEATWKRYDLFGIEGLREQKLLRQASQKLNARWRKKRPAMFNSDLKKVKND